MVFLIGSILLSSYLTLSFKVLERLGINAYQAIVVNYITCVITGSLMNGTNPFRNQLLQNNWLPWAIGMGCLLISLFNIIAITARRSGVAVASVANKLSLVIPFIFAVVFYQERITVFKLAGILFALLAVIWVSQRNKDLNGPGTFSISVPLLPLLLFFGSGLLDTLIKYTEQRFLDGTNNNDFLVTAFGSAAVLGCIILFVQVILKKTTISWKAVLAGIAIGIPNYFSIWCLVKVLKFYSGNSSVIIPVNNMGVVAFSTLAAAAFFHEKLSRKNWLGIILSLVAIALIAFG
jgi:drug/metabolite transporter (DMT)-like permease